MMGEIWAKLASKYSKALDIPNFNEVFEPNQTAVGARGGPERVLQAMQAAVELRPTDVVLHADVIDAYPSVNRGLMLNEVYGDTRLRHMALLRLQLRSTFSRAGSSGRQSSAFLCLRQWGSPGQCSV